jgi:hypothetical protein
MRNLSLFLLLLIFAVSCGKTNRVTIQGRVLNPVTGEGIEGAKIILMKYTGGLPAGTKTVSSAYSASDGSFEVSAKGLFKNFTADCILDANAYHWIGWMKDGEQYTILSPKLGKITYADYYAVPFGKLQINIKNVNCFDGNDELKLYFDGGAYDGHTFNSGLITTLTGCIDIPGTPVKTTMGYKYFHWEVTKNGSSQTFYDTVIVQNGAITEFDVLY